MLYSGTFPPLELYELVMADPCPLQRASGFTGHADDTCLVPSVRQGGTCNTLVAHQGPEAS